MEAELDYIEHIGLVTDIRSGHAKVSLVDDVSCHDCRLNALCGVQDSDRRLIDIPFADTDYHVGDEVFVRVKSNTGMKALLFGYLIPFLIVVGTLLITLNIDVAEHWAGLISLAVLIPYFLGLVAVRHWLRHVLKLEMRKR